MVYFLRIIDYTQKLTLPPITNKQLYCLHFTFTGNVKYMASHMSKKKEIHDIYTITKSLELFNGYSILIALIELLRGIQL